MHTKWNSQACQRGREREAMIFLWVISFCRKISSRKANTWNNGRPDRHNEQDGDKLMKRFRTKQNEKKMNSTHEIHLHKRLPTRKENNQEKKTMTNIFGRTKKIHTTFFGDRRSTSTGNDSSDDFTIDKNVLKQNEEKQIVINTSFYGKSSIVDNWNGTMVFTWVQSPGDSITVFTLDSKCSFIIRWLIIHYVQYSTWLSEPVVKCAMKLEARWDQDHFSPSPLLLTSHQTHAENFDN